MKKKKNPANDFIKINFETAKWEREVRTSYGCQVFWRRGLWSSVLWPDLEGHLPDGPVSNAIWSIRGWFPGVLHRRVATEGPYRVR